MSVQITCKEEEGRWLRTGAYVAIMGKMLISEVKRRGVERRGEQRSGEDRAVEVGLTFSPGHPGQCTCYGHMYSTVGRTAVP